MCMCTSMQTLYIPTYIYPSSSMHELCVQVGFTHKPENICIRTYCIAEIFCRRIFRGINFTICVLIVRICALILTISRIGSNCKQFKILTPRKFHAIWYVCDSV